MRHKREEVIERTIREFELLDQLVAGLTNAEWERLLRLRRMALCRRYSSFLR